MWKRKMTKLAAICIIVIYTIVVVAEGGKGRKGSRYHGLILEKSYSYWRSAAIYDARQDMRKYLSLRDTTKMGNRPRTKYMAFQLRQVSRSCKGVTELKPGKVVCIECSRFTQINALNHSCRGRGAWLMTSYWNHAIHSNCHGTWFKLSGGRRGVCKPKWGQSWTFV